MIQKENNTNSIVETLLEVDILEQNNFLKIRETLRRMGISSTKDMSLYQSCHILHKRGKYYITHFKEMFALDGKEVDISEEDIIRRNTIATLLEEWGLLEILDEGVTENTNFSTVKVISFKEKDKWNLKSKYTVGNKNRNYRKG